MQTIKCVIIGDGAVGKSCLIASYVNKKFINEYIPTIYDSYTANLIVDGNLINLYLHDTAGQPDYATLTPFSYPQTDIFLCCFNLIYRPSFENIKRKWYPELKKHVPNAQIILVGTKLDLRDNYKNNLNDKLIPVTYEQGLQMCKDISAVKYIECSSLSYNSIHILFEDVVKVSIDHNINKNIKNKCCIFL